MLQSFLNFLLPPECILCNVPLAHAHSLCGECFGKIQFITSPLCDLCGYPLPEGENESLCVSCISHPPVFDKARSIFAYDIHSRDLILRLKHGDAMHLSLPLARLFQSQCGCILKNADHLIPVPLHRLRLWKRRYNQATLLARALFKVMKDHEKKEKKEKKSEHTLPSVLTNILVRTRPTVSQGHGSASMRHLNVKGAFAVTAAQKIKGKSIVLVDDVFTSGATVKACTKALKRAGAASVTVLTLARVVSSRNILME